MKILILGGKGFIGSHLVNKLSTDNLLFVADQIDCQDKNYYKIKLDDSEAIKKIIDENQIEIVIHLVSSLLPSSNLNDYYKELNNIYAPTVELLDYCSNHNIKFFYFSSGGTVYGRQREIFNEHTKREPVSYYGLSKLIIENTIQFYHNTKALEYIIVRPSNPYGYGQNLYGRQGLIAIIIGKILKNEIIQIWGNGSVVKDYIYIDDLIYYVEKLILRKDAWNQIYNIGSGKGITINEVLETFSKNNIKLPEIEYIDQKKSDVTRMILDCTKIQEMFNHKNVSLEDGIKKFWEKVK